MAFAAEVSAKLTFFVAQNRADMEAKQIQILDAEAIEQRTRRIAYQIAEDNHDEQELFIIGVKTDGYHFAEKVVKELQAILPLKIHLHAIRIDKRNPLSGKLEFDFDQEALNDKVVVLVDDVANTGRTLLFAMKPLLECLPKKIRIAVLVDRQHKRFSICSDYVGKSLATTMQENIRVEISQGKEIAYLC